MNYGYLYNLTFTFLLSSEILTNQIRGRLRDLIFFFFLNTKTSELDTAVTDSLMNSHLFFLDINDLPLTKGSKNFMKV